MTPDQARISGWRRLVPAWRRTRGQSLVEFALVTPILVMLVVVVADFGRVFAANLTLEAAARNAAEIGANAYLSRPPGADASPPVPLSANAPSPGDPSYYGDLHRQIARVVCAETSDLANSNFDPATGDCSGMPFVQACIHDSEDPHCQAEAYGNTIPADCGSMHPGPTNAQPGDASQPQPRFVEVLVCYRFTAIVDLPFVPWTQIWLQRSRMFTIPCYYALGDAECG